MSGRVVHFEVPFDDGDRARSFYKEAFGWQLMEIMIEYARWLGLRVIEGQVLRENRTMLAMCQQFGFRVVPDPDDSLLVDVVLSVREGDAANSS